MDYSNLTQREMKELKMLKRMRRHGVTCIIMLLLFYVSQFGALPNGEKIFFGVLLLVGFISWYGINCAIKDYDWLNESEEW